MRSMLAQKSVFNRSRECACLRDPPPNCSRRCTRRSRAHNVDAQKQDAWQRQAGVVTCPHIARVSGDSSAPTSVYERLRTAREGAHGGAARAMPMHKGTMLAKANRRFDACTHCAGELRLIRAYERLRTPTNANEPLRCLYYSQYESDKIEQRCSACHH